MPKHKTFEDLVVKTARKFATELSKDKKNKISKDTLIIFMDKSGRFVSSPLMTALKEKGIEVPRTSYFLNYSYIDNKFRTPEERAKGLQEFISSNLGRRNFSNVLIVDEFAGTGRTLHEVKGAFQKLTKNPVATLAFGMERPGVTYKPDFFSAPLIDRPIFSSLRTHAKPVRDAKSVPLLKTNEQEKQWAARFNIPVVLETVPNTRGMRVFSEFQSKVKKSFSKPVKGGIRSRISTIRRK